MGNSISQVCCQNEFVKQRVEVLVLKEDGESLRFKEGTFVKDILSAYPYHKIIRCCSLRTVLSGETQLSCNWLYLLLPVGLALSEAAYQNLVRSAASQNLIARPQKIKFENIQQESQKGNEGDRQDKLYNEYSFSYRWKPILRTIPEIASPST